MFDLLNYIPTGKPNAISSRDLANLCGCKSVRELQRLIEQIRNQDIVICSSHNGGYYLYENVSELREYVRTQKNRGMNTLKSVSGAEQLLAILDGKE